MQYVIWGLVGLVVCFLAVLVIRALAFKPKAQPSVTGEAVAFEAAEGKAVLPIGGRCYLKTSLSKDEIVKAFENSKLN